MGSWHGPTIATSGPAAYCAGRFAAMRITHRPRLSSSLDNCPVIIFFYKCPPPDYKSHMNAEGQLVAANRAWHQENRIYVISYGIGTAILLYGLIRCVHPRRPDIATLANLLVAFVCLVTLSLLITAAENWVPALGDAERAFSYLSGHGRQVMGDSIVLGTGFVTMPDSASARLRRRAEVFR